MNPQILYEDDSIIVCRKPAGIPTQTRKIGTPDLVSILKNHLAGEASPLRRAAKEPYLAVIHRLDQPVEGLLVFAKTPGAAKELNRQLTGAGFGKYYHAMVHGIPSPQEGTLKDYMVKDSRTNSSAVCPEGTPGSKLACLHYKVITPYPGRSLLDIRLDTGRHHQIRVQLAHAGCPIIGDRKYGSRKDPGTLMLCAYRLQFCHPGDERLLTFDLPQQNMGHVV